MSKEIKDKARDYLKAELSVIPTKEDKLPALPAWKQYQSQRLKEDEVEDLFKGGSVKGLAIICGAVSGNLEVIDVDTKHDSTGSLWDEIKDLIENNLPEIYSSLVIAQTKSGGYHIYYRCSSIAGNLKLSVKKNREVLVETRGEGGYVIAPPTQGYEYIQGEPSNIPTLSPETREILLSISKSFNELEEIKPIVKLSSTSSSSTGLSPYEDYNQRGNILQLLQSKGWSVVSQRGERVYLLRPGDTKTKYSGNYHTGLRTLRVFSSSTELNPDIAYNPSQVYSLLECGGDTKLTYRRLLEEGYGEPYKGERIKPTQVKTERITVNIVNIVNRESSVISTPGEVLRIENVETAIGEEVVIGSPGLEAQEEVLKAIELLQETGKRIYVNEDGLEIRDYRYQLRAIFNKYAVIQDEAGELTDRQVDSLKDEIVITAQRLQPIDRDLFKKEFLSQDAVKELGITEEAYLETVDRLTTTRAKEAQSRALREALVNANQLQATGRSDEAIKALETQLIDLKVTEARDLLPPPMSFNSLLAEIANTPPSYKTGYTTLDSFIGFTPGAVSLVAGRPSHGKTTFMFNLLLEMSKLYPDEKFYFFTYEEPVKNISVKLLNRLIASDLRGHFSKVEDLNRPTNYEFIKHYIKAGRTDIREIEDGKRLLRDLVDSQRITVVERDYSVEELDSLLLYLSKKERIGSVIIDYIQRMRTQRRTQDKRTEIAHISDLLRKTAVKTGLPIILGAQLNRATDVKGGKPKLENLKEAGNLEEDANTVISVYCRAREEEELDNGADSSKERIVDLEIKALKNRDGEVNTVETLDWDRWTGVMRDRASSKSKLL